ncbi:unnamed protein product [Adineta steineri]|uniref:Uncharacterized protein n=1 Tax=Adineta steineri TaxID=433720 RepID=A0A816FMC0_9BILA|nr:unnamed protein product [Adineta steineri]CAF1663454.1 unnamed protein product [Adineta steineri]
MGEASFKFNDKNQQAIIDLFGDREIKPIQEELGRVNVNPIRDHVKFLMKKLFIIIFLFIVAIIGLVSLIIGVIAYKRQCYLPRQPSLPIWLLVLGSTSIILIIALINLILVATVIKYKTSEKAFRRAFMIIVGIGGGVLSWAVGPGSQAMFYLPSRSSDCLVFFSFIYGIYCIYKFWSHCCCKNKKGKNQVAVVVVPLPSNGTQNDLPNVIDAIVREENSVIPMKTSLPVDDSIKREN